MEAIIKKQIYQPRFRGSGLMMRLQFRKETLVKGDTCWDVDEGFLEWNGKEWISKEDED